MPIEEQQQSVLWGRVIHPKSKQDQRLGHKFSTAQGLVLYKRDQQWYKTLNDEISQRGGAVRSLVRLKSTALVGESVPVLWMVETVTQFLFRLPPTDASTKF